MFLSLIAWNFDSWLFLKGRKYIIYINSFVCTLVLFKRYLRLTYVHAWINLKSTCNETNQCMDTVRDIVEGQSIHSYAKLVEEIRNKIQIQVYVKMSNFFEAPKSICE